ncbi:LOW QUALITY PROTEIN: 25-hydroxyvitamin D-1 alpha hydroxylase, mitochondrial [Ammospiza maritima maritima]
MSPGLRLPARAALLSRSPPEPGLPPRAPPVPAAPSPPSRSPPEPSRPRGLAEMPGPSSAAFIFELLCRGGVRRLHEMQIGDRGWRRWGDPARPGDSSLVTPSWLGGHQSHQRECPRGRGGPRSSHPGGTGDSDLCPRGWVGSGHPEVPPGLAEVALGPRAGHGQSSPGSGRTAGMGTGPPPGGTEGQGRGHPRVGSGTEARDSVTAGPGGQGHQDLPVSRVPLSSPGHRPSPVHGRSRFGPVWRARFGPVLTVHVAEPALVAQVLRQEGPEPRRALSCPWKQHRELRGAPGGLLTLEGDAWRGSRRLLARALLRPGAAEAFALPVAAAVTELVARLRRLRRRHPRGLVRDIGTEFNRFGLEAISWVLFSSRLGCLGDPGDSGDSGDTEAVLQSVGAVLALTLVTMALPRPLLRLVPAPWDAFCHAWDQLFAFAKGHVDRRVAAVAARGPLAEGDTCVTDLLARERVPVTSIYGNVTELLLAGVDTVASTLAWSLYELARNPGAQAALHRQLLAATATNGGDSDSATTERATAAATAAALGRLPLLRAVVKETLRLYPVIPANARVVPECDIRVGDYLVPRQTLITLCHYATSRDSRYFPPPDAFRPERWLRHGDSGDTTPGPRHPFASLPFGLGPRSCVGRRLAELQLHLALAQILLRFEVRPEPGGGRVRPMTRTLLAPGAPISLRFLERVAQHEPVAKPGTGSSRERLRGPRVAPGNGQWPTGGFGVPPSTCGGGSARAPQHRLPITGCGQCPPHPVSLGGSLLPGGPPRMSPSRGGPAPPTAPCVCIAPPLGPAQYPCLGPAPSTVYGYSHAYIIIRFLLTAHAHASAEAGRALP